MKKTNENLGKTMNENFIKGLVGKEEDTSQARVLKSSQPLPNEMLKIKKGYIVCLAVILVGLILQPLWLLGLVGLMVVYIIDSCIVDQKRNRLRRAKFKASSDINNENLFETIQPIFTTKYNMLVEKREDGAVMITYNGYTYDVLLQDDGTFVIWWRMSLSKSFVSHNKYKSYRQILAAMGIIGFEIQNAFGIN